VLGGRRRAAAVVVTLVLTGAGVVGVAGCTGSGDPDPTPSTSRVVTPSPTPTASPVPTRPAAMDEVSTDGAIAAATYFLQLYPYAYNTGDLTEWKALSHPECKFCASVVDDVTATFAKQHHSEGGGFEVAESSGSEIDPGKWFSVTILADQLPWTELDSSGTVVDSDPESHTIDVVFAVVVGDSGWLIRGVQIEDHSTDDG
jgi:hypothetical protein